MKKNRVLALSILACTLLAGCDDNTFVSYNGKVGKVNTEDTFLTVEKFYEDVKTSYGGTIALDKLLEKIARIEYTVDSNSTTNVQIKDFTFANDSVKAYRTNAKFQEEIQETFKDIVEGTSYLDDDGKFDKEELKEHIEEDHNIVAKDGVTSYLANYPELQAQLGYNYDEYIEEELIPSILVNYLYYDYLLGSSKYKGQFSSQYATKLQVLKIPYDTTSLNYRWNEALVSMVKAVTNGSASTFDFAANYSEQSFYTFNSDLDLIAYNVTTAGISYDVYDYNDANKDAIDALYNNLFKFDLTSKRVAKKDYDTSLFTGLTRNDAESFAIDGDTRANQEFYEKVEKILIARDLWFIDREVVLARNFDYKEKSSYYDAMTSSEKSECETYASTYSSSNSKPMKTVVKEKKITTQQEKFYTEPDYYTKSNISNVLPDALSSLRGTSAKEIYSHLKSFVDGEPSTFLVTSQTKTNPVYLDTSGSNYYVCEVSEYYGYYVNANPLDTTSTYLSKVNYQIEAYQAGSYNEYALNASGSYEAGEAVSYAATDAKFESIINLVQTSAENVISDSIKKEAVVALFEKYGLEINDQEVYDSINSKYPDYFDDED